MPSSVFQSMLPGQQVDADEQCEIQYGVGYRRCPEREVPEESNRILQMIKKGGKVLKTCSCTHNLSSYEIKP